MKNATKRPMSNRFWTKVDKSGSCWVWTSYKHQGYGRWWNGKKADGAHRYSWIEKYGEIPKEKVIDHLCRNRACVNPEHMHLVSRGENVMLGIGIASSNKKKTKCPMGHPYDIIKKSGDRACRTCKNIQDNIRYPRYRTAKCRRERIRYWKNKLKLAKGE